MASADTDHGLRDHCLWETFKYAFKKTLPILAGFWFLGLAYGIYMNALGFSFVYPMLLSLLIFGGSLEFLVPEMMLSAISPITALLITLAVQSRHLFYGITMLEKYSKTGWMKPYLIFGMCDETFAINCSTEPPNGINRKWFMFFVTLLNHFYWVSGSTIGGLAGSLIAFDTEGISFVMTALFAVIFVDNLLKTKNYSSALIGLVSGVACLCVFGADDFMFPTLLVTAIVLLIARRGREESEPQ